VPLPDWQVNLLLRELEVRAIHGFVWDVRGQCIPNGHGSRSGGGSQVCVVQGVVKVRDFCFDFPGFSRQADFLGERQSAGKFLEGGLNFLVMAVQDGFGTQMRDQVAVQVFDLNGATAMWVCSSAPFALHSL
jgi:hypothetical protein